MDRHKFATYFPPMTPGDFDELVEDIKVNGLIDPITTLDGEILDGVHRFKACELTGTKPRFEVWSDGDPLRWVLSKNLHRRHLTAGQKSMVLIDAGLLETDPGKGPVKVSIDRGILSADDAASEAGTSTATVERVRAVAARDPELAEDIRSGEKSASLAYVTLRVREFGKKIRGKKEAQILIDRIESGEAGSRIVVDILAAAEVAREYGDLGRSKQILKAPYNRNTTTGSAEREYQEGLEKVTKTKKTKRQKARWEDLPEVAAILRAFQSFSKAIPKFTESVRAGKLSPEAKKFLAERVGQLVAEVKGLLKQLEDLRKELEQ